MHKHPKKVYFEVPQSSIDALDNAIDVDLRGQMVEKGIPIKIYSPDGQANYFYFFKITR